MALAPAAHGEFALNFSGTTSTSVIQGTTTITGQTPFTPGVANQATGEYVVDPSTGQGYWHYIVGDPSQGFAQEVYIRATAQFCADNSICSASAGSTGSAPSFNLLGSNNTLTGNGTGNPNDVLIRQVVGGTWNAATSTWTCDTSFCDEFIKSSYADKPEIIQGINTSDFTAKFILDMSGILYSNNSTSITAISGNASPTGASITNVQSVINPATGNVISSFDLSKDGQQTHVNGGQYTYTPGKGTLGSGGNYVYVDGGYDLNNVDYTPFLDSVDSNPWTYSAGKP